MALIARKSEDEEDAGRGTRVRSRDERAAEFARLKVLLGGSAGGAGVGLLGRASGDGADGADGADGVAGIAGAAGAAAGGTEVADSVVVRAAGVADSVLDAGSAFSGAAGVAGSVVAGVAGVADSVLDVNLALGGAPHSVVDGGSVAAGAADSLLDAGSARGGAAGSVLHAVSTVGGVADSALGGAVGSVLDSGSMISGAASSVLGGADVGAPDIPALAALRGVLPGGVLRRGGVVAVQDRVRAWAEAPSYLALALAAGASGGGAWCGVVGLPAFGIAAASGMGADLSRFLLVDEPGERWAEAVAVLAGAVDLVLVRPPRRPTGEQVRRIGARIRRTTRQRGAALVVAGEWPGADLRLRLTESAWSGLGTGTGHLTGRRVTVAAGGRGAAGRERTARLWLPAADGTVREWIGAAGENTDLITDLIAGPITGPDSESITDPSTGPNNQPAAGRQRFPVSAEIRDGGEVVRLWSA